MPASPDRTTTERVRDEVRRARDILRQRAASEGAPALAAGSEDFVRRYLRVLSLQAVGQFSDAMSGLSDGLAAVVEQGSAQGERVAQLEQDLLALVHHLISEGTLGEGGPTLLERVEALEQRQGADGPASVGTLTLYAAMSRVLADAAPGRPAGGGLEIGVADLTWLDAAATAGVPLRPLAMDALQTHPPASLDLVSAAFIFDALGAAEAAAAAARVHRVLRPDGVLVAVIETLAVCQVPRPVGHRPVSAPGVLADILAAAGFSRVADAALPLPGAHARVLTARVP